MIGRIPRADRAAPFRRSPPWILPYKFNESRRHKIPKARYRVTNWPEYDGALVRRGGITVWFTDEAGSVTTVGRPDPPGVLNVSSEPSLVPPAFVAEIPEVDHNEIAGWDSAHELGPFSAVFLDDCDLHPRIRQRIELTRGLISSRGAVNYKVESIGETRTERRYSGSAHVGSRRTPDTPKAAAFRNRAPMFSWSFKPSSTAHIRELLRYPGASS